LALERMGKLLMQALRQTDAAFRTGGDEFAILLPETEEAELRAVIDRISAGLVKDDDPRFEDLRASFGVAVYPRDGDDPETVLTADDQGLYSAQRARET